MILKEINEDFLEYWRAFKVRCKLLHKLWKQNELDIEFQRQMMLSNKSA